MHEACMSLVGKTKWVSRSLSLEIHLHTLSHKLTEMNEGGTKGCFTKKTWGYLKMDNGGTWQPCKLHSGQVVRQFTQSIV